MINNSDKIKLSFNSMDDFLMELQDYRSSNDDINTFSIIGDRGYGKSTVLQHIYDRFSNFQNKSDLAQSSCNKCYLSKAYDCSTKNCINSSRYVTLQIINPDHLKSADIMSWLIGAFDTIVNDMKKIWVDIPICKKNIYNSQMQEFLNEIKSSKKIDINEQRKFFLEEWYDELITDCYKRSNEYRDSVLKQFKENFEYKEKFKKILSSDRQFKDNYDEFVRCLMMTFKSIKGLNDTPKLLILIDDLDIHPKYAYDILIDTCIMLNNRDTVIVIAGNLEGFTQSVKATLYDEYLSDVQLGLVNNNYREFEIRKEYLDQLSRNTINKALPISKRYFLNGIDNISAFIPISKENKCDSDLGHRSIGYKEGSEALKAESHNDIDNLESLIKKTISVENDDTLLNLFHNSPRKLSSLYEILDDIKRLHNISASKENQIDAPKYFNNMTKLLRYDTSVIDDSILSIMANSLKYMSAFDQSDKHMSSNDFTTTRDSISNYYTTLRDNYSDSDSINKILVSFTDVLILYICWIYYICSNEDCGKVESKKNVLELIKIVSEIMNANVLPKRSVLPTTINLHKDKEAFKLYLKIYIANTLLAIENRSTNFFNNHEYSYGELRKSQLFFDLIFLKSRQESSEEMKVEKILDLNRYNIRNISIVDEINQSLKLDESEIKKAVKTLYHEIIGLSSNRDMFNALVQLKSSFISERCKDAVNLLDDRWSYKSSIIKYEDFTYTRYLELEEMKSKIIQSLDRIGELKIINEEKTYDIELITYECDRLISRLIEVIDGLIDFDEVNEEYDINKIPDVFKDMFSIPNIETSREYDFGIFKSNIKEYLVKIKERITVTTIIESINDLVKVIKSYCENLDELLELISDLHKGLDDRLDKGINSDIYDSDTIFGLEEAIVEVNGYMTQTTDIKRRFEIMINPSYHDAIQEFKRLVFDFIEKCSVDQDIDVNLIKIVSELYINSIDKYCSIEMINSSLNDLADAIENRKVFNDLPNSIYGLILIDVLRHRDDSIKLQDLLISSKSNLNEIINFTNKYMAFLIIDQLNLKSIVTSNPMFEVYSVDLDLVEELNKVKYSISSKLNDVNSILDNLINYTDPIYADRVRFVIKLYLSGLNFEENVSAISSSRYVEMVDRIRTSIDRPKNYDLTSISRLENISYDLDFSNNTENDIANGTKFFDTIIDLISESIEINNQDVQGKNVNDIAGAGLQENNLESDGTNEQNIEESTS